MNTFWGVVGIIFFIIIFILFLGSIWLKRGLAVLNKTHTPSEIILGEGEKTAIIIYQPTKHDTAYNITMAIANVLKENGYTVTINYPSDEINYNLSEYDLIVFGSGAYVGKSSPVLGNYILKNRFRDKKVLIYTVGKLIKDDSDLKELKVLLDGVNDVKAIKVKKGQEENIERFVEKVIKD